MTLALKCNIKKNNYSLVSFWGFCITISQYYF